MPKGIPVATFAIGEAGCRQCRAVCRGHAGQPIAGTGAALKAFRQKQADTVLAMTLPEVL